MVHAHDAQLLSNTTDDNAGFYRKIKQRSLVTDDYPSFSEISCALRDVKSKKRSVLVTVWNILQRFKKWIAGKMYQQLPKSMKRIENHNETHSGDP